MALVYTHEAAENCERAFGFLASEYGYRQQGPELRSEGFRLRYFGPVLGVEVNWYPRDEFTVWLVILVDDEFPEYPLWIYPETELHYFDLGDVEAISGHESGVDPGRLYSPPDEELAGLVAESLRSCADDLLRGDLTRVPELRQRIMTRTRAAAIEELGAERAKEIGF